MIDKTRLGLPFWDERYGGIYRHRPVLCVGRQGSGKTLVALHALMQCIPEGERGLMLSTWRAPDLILFAANMGLPLSEAIARGRIILLEYTNIMPVPDVEQNFTLPPGSFLEFENIVASHGISRVVIDTILPWVAITNAEKLPKHVYSFIHALERMKVTSLFTMPRPASALAFTLRNLVDHLVPITFALDRDAAGRHTLLVTKYIGFPTLQPAIPFRIASGAGIVGPENPAPAIPPADNSPVNSPVSPAASPARISPGPVALSPS